MKAQVRNLYVEGFKDQYGVIHTKDESNSSKSGIELLRGTSFLGNDWRIQNNGGTLQFLDGHDNFKTSGTLNMSISKDGLTQLYNGTDAQADDNSSGILTLGNPNNTHLALDGNGIIARES